MPHLISTVLFLVGFAFSGCATTTTGPTPAGDNIYVMSRQEGAFPSGDEQLLAEVMKEANIFCNSQNKKLHLIDSRENPGPYILGNYPKATITFSCMEKQ